MAEAPCIEKVAVLGAGVMGSAIAAHVANAGVPVVLLDIVPKGANDRNVLAAGAVQKMLKAKPAPFMHKRTAKLITLQHLDHSVGQAHRGLGRGLRRRLRRHPLLQPAALHAAAGDRRRGEDQPGCPRGPQPLRGGAPRQGGGDLPRHARLHRQPHRYLLELPGHVRGHAPRPHRRGGGRGGGPAHGHPQNRHLRPRRPHRHRPRAPRKPEHAGAAARERSLLPGLRPRRPARSHGDADDRRGAHRPQGQGRLLSPHQGGRHEHQGDARLRALRVPPPDQGTARQRQGGARGLACARRARGQGRGVRLGGAGPDARLCRRANPRDRRQHRRRGPGHAQRLRLEARPLRADRPARRRLARRAPGGRRGRRAGALAARRGPAPLSRGRRPAAVPHHGRRLCRRAGGRGCLAPGR